MAEVVWKGRKEQKGWNGWGMEGEKIKSAHLAICICIYYIYIISPN